MNSSAAIAEHTRDGGEAEPLPKRAARRYEQARQQRVMHASCVVAALTSPKLNSIGGAWGIGHQGEYLGQGVLFVLGELVPFTYSA
jgi:hypothetical protein